MNRHQRRAAKHHPINGHDITIKDGKVVHLPKKKKGPPTFDERVSRALAPIAYYGMKPVGTDEARVSVTVYRERFIVLEVRAPRKGESPSSFAIAIREALAGIK